MEHPPHPLPREQVTAVGVRALLESLRLFDASGDRLVCLELDFNPLGDAGAQPLPAYLKERAARGGGGLEELSLRFCDIGPAGCRFGSVLSRLVFYGVVVDMIWRIYSSRYRDTWLMLSQRLSALSMRAACVRVRRRLLLFVRNPNDNIIQ